MMRHLPVAALGLGSMALLLILGPSSSARALISEKLVKGATSEVYWISKDKKRYVFPNEQAFLSWFPISQFGNVIELTPSELAKYPFGGFVSYRPGIRMVKIPSDPKVYAIGQGHIIRWVQSEEIAQEIYGESWNAQIDDVTSEYLGSYQTGEDIDDPADFQPTAEAASSISPSNGGSGGGVAIPAEPLQEVMPIAEGEIISTEEGEVVPETDESIPVAETEVAIDIVEEMLSESLDETETPMEGTVEEFISSNVPVDEGFVEPEAFEMPVENFVEEQTSEEAFSIEEPGTEFVEEFPVADEAIVAEEVPDQAIEPELKPSTIKPPIQPIVTMPAPIPIITKPVVTISPTIPKPTTTIAPTIPTPIAPRPTTTGLKLPALAPASSPTPAPTATAPIIPARPTAPALVLPKIIDPVITDSKFVLGQNGQSGTVEVKLSKPVKSATMAISSGGVPLTGLQSVIGKLANSVWTFLIATITKFDAKHDYKLNVVDAESSKTVSLTGSFQTPSIPPLSGVTFIIKPSNSVMSIGSAVTLNVEANLNGGSPASIASYAIKAGLVTTLACPTNSANCSITLPNASSLLGGSDFLMLPQAELKDRAGNTFTSSKVAVLVKQTDAATATFKMTQVSAALDSVALKAQVTGIFTKPAKKITLKVYKTMGADLVYEQSLDQTAQPLANIALPFSGLEKGSSYIYLLTADDATSRASVTRGGLITVP